jgi:adenylate cyclase
MRQDRLKRVLRRGLAGRVAGTAALVLLLSLKLFDPWPLVTLRNATFDWFQQSLPRTIASPPVAIIDIDDQSLRALGQWPWPRRDLARLVDRLTEAGVRVVVFDMVFAESDRNDPSGDQVFALSLKRLPAVGGLALARPPAPIMAPTPPPVAGFANLGPDPQPHLPAFALALAPPTDLRSAFAGLGGLNGWPERDGVFRRIPLLFSVAGRIFPSLALETIRVFLGGTTYLVKSTGSNDEPGLGTDSGVVSIRVGGVTNSMTIPTDHNAALYLNPGRFPADLILSAKDVLDGEQPPTNLSGRIALIGTSAPGLADLRQSAIGLRPGVELEAQAISQILAGDYVRHPDWMFGFEAVLSALIGILLLLALPRLNAVSGAVFGGIVLIALGIAGWTAYAQGHWLFDPVFPALSTGAVYVATTLGGFFETERERSFIRQAFSRYLSPALVSQLTADPSKLRLGGERRDMTFLITDLEAFTRLTEQLGPETLAPIVNSYFDGAGNVITSHGGLVDQFVGDAILAFFNAPLDQSDHAARALACARDLDRFCEEFRIRQNAAGIPFGRTRIGVHSGTAVVGNFGSTHHFQYAALGDTLNSAARLESLNKYFGTRICTSAETVRRSGDQSVRPLATVLPQGKTESIEVWEVLAPDQFAPSFLQTYGEAFARLKSGEADAARTLFSRLAAENPEDTPTRTHLARIDAGHRDVLFVMDRK